MFEEKAQSYRVKDKEIYRVKLACQNTKIYRVNTHLTKGTITLLYFFCFFLHMRTLSVLDKYRANVLGSCRARAITLFTVFPWRVTYMANNTSANTENLTQLFQFQNYLEYIQGWLADLKCHSARELISIT